MEKPLGNYMEIITARSTDPEIRSKSQDGGIVSAAFIYGLENGILDGAIVASAPEKHNPVPAIARTRDEILAARGTKYSVSPNVSILKDAAREYALEKIGFVGTPCQLLALRKMIKYPLGFRHINNKIGIIVGIFCMENFNYQAMKILIEQYADVSMDDILKTDIGSGKFWVYKKDGSEPITVPLKETHIFEQKSCHICTDYTSELSDFSTGSVGSPDGWSTVIIRTKKGKEYIDKMIEDGLLETMPADTEGKTGITLLEKLSNGKKEKNSETIRVREENGLSVPKIL